MSSEESVYDTEGSDDDYGPRKRQVRTLSWESTKLSEYKKKLDRAFKSQASKVTLRHMAPVVRNKDCLSKRPVPDTAPEWATTANKK